MRVHGSYTVEAVFLFPMILFLIIFSLQLSVSWYQSAYETSQDLQAVRELDTQEYFYKAKMRKDIKKILEQ